MEKNDPTHAGRERETPPQNNQLGPEPSRAGGKGVAEPAASVNMVSRGRSLRDLENFGCQSGSESVLSSEESKTPSTPKTEINKKVSSGLGSRQLPVPASAGAIQPAQAVAEESGFLEMMVTEADQVTGSLGKVFKEKKLSVQNEEVLKSENKKESEVLKEEKEFKLDDTAGVAVSSSVRTGEKVFVPVRAELPLHVEGQEPVFAELTVGEHGFGQREQVSCQVAVEKVLLLPMPP